MWKAIGPRAQAGGRAPGLPGVALWTLCLLQILSSAPNRPFTLLEPWTAGWWVLLGAFALTSSALLLSAPLLTTAHLAVVAVLFFLRPLSSVFGRDGALALVGVYGLTLLWTRTRLRSEVKLLASSSLAGLLLLEAGLSVADGRAARTRAGLFDFGDLLGPCGLGGCLRPGLDVAIVTGKGPGRFVTSHHGFRNRGPVHRRKAPGVRRVLFIGDSFVAGYRTDQEETVGRRVELALREEGRYEPVEVLIAQLPHPQAARDYLQRRAWRLTPDLIVIGLTLGNDLAQAWAVRRQVPEALIAGLLLPADAFRQDAGGRAGLRLERSLRSWRSYRRLTMLWREDPVTTDYGDSPGRVHVFDAMHGLGYAYSRRLLPLVEQSWQENESLLRELLEAARDCGAPLIVSIFPQRFQTREAAWEATAFEYGLDRRAFDPQLPNRRLAALCASAAIECVDLLPAFREEPEPTYLPSGDMHWNERGHAVAARALLPAVRARLGRGGSDGTGN